ncbi:DUF4383 domain-containing protein [Streptomyces litchfieldiae]|uniref:DUF4383 domain-containing protein n=1 Tax=Streptomyces litchfieldiae TaxID=3075543 RepID=A0ABU2MXB1_9ACTN|nr:DUF4383 domain-containing protein [Streptomyces sp. DSM 44938]MDT0346293.1 DUF4383 domain-containing protein [Streptomyces sp. DSM 44938]
MSTYTMSGSPRLPRSGPRALLRRTHLDEHLPVDRKLSRVYRIGAALVGLGLLIFGVLGLTRNIGLFATHDETVWGLNTDGALSWLSVVVGLLLLAGMIKGGNFASTLNMLLGMAFILSGFANLAVLETDANILNFRMQNVIFSFAVGLLLMTFGMYGRVSGRLPHDNPYWRARNPEAGRDAERRHQLVERRRRELSARARRTRAEAEREESPHHT